MEASVIIPTYNGAEKILQILENLSLQTFNNFEIIIGIDGSTDDTENIIETQKNIDKRRIIVFKQKNKGRSVIRNNTAKLAKTDLLIFYDDDVQPAPNSVEKHILFHQKNESTILAAKIAEKYDNLNVDFLKFREYLTKKWIENYGNGITELTRENLFLSAANFSISKQLFFVLNGFDEYLRDAEDWDFAINAVENHIKIFFDADNIVWHNDPLTCREYIIRQRQYKENHELLAKTKPDLYRLYNERLIAPKQSILRKLVYLILANKWSVKQVDNNFYTFLPQSIRYKLYDIVITGLSHISPNKKI